MKIIYDPRYNIAYIHLREKTEEVETIKISDELHIDLSPDGKIYGIELLNANEQLQISEDGELVFVDESTGKSFEFTLSAIGKR